MVNTGWCIVHSYIAISNSFELDIYLLTIYCDPYFLKYIDQYYEFTVAT